MKRFGKYDVLKRGRDMTDAFVCAMKEQSKPRRFLVVEDNLLDLAWFKNQARHVEDGEFDYAMSGEEAVEFVSKNEYRFMFVDLNLPGMSGLEFLEKVNNSTKIPCAVVTGTFSLSSVECEQASELGALFLIKKPIQASQIIALVNPA